MKHDNFEKLLKLHYRKVPGNPKLNHLEQDVWRQIHLRKAKPKGMFERLLTVILLSQYRYATMTFTLVIALLISSLTEQQTPLQLASASFNFQVFASNYNYLPSTHLR